MSQFKFLTFSRLYLIFSSSFIWVLSQFEFSVLSQWVLEFCDNMSFWFLSLFKIFGIVIIWFFLVQLFVGPSVRRSVHDVCEKVTFRVWKVIKTYLWDSCERSESSKSSDSSDSRPNTFVNRKNVTFVKKWPLEYQRET